MAKTKIKAKPYRCTGCETEYSKWQGQCSHCGQWNLIEEVIGSSGSPVTKDAMALSKIPSAKDAKIHTTALTFLDRVLGGGVPGGTTLLLAGEPGIGKSTVLFQMMAAQKETVLYVSAEESLSQLASRFKNLSAQAPDHLLLFTDPHIELIETQIKKTKPAVVVIDSIQMILSDDVSRAKGGVSTLRETTDRLVQMAKAAGCILWIVGHVNKEGEIAGPKVLEHMVDTVLTFSMARESHLRILQVGKHRFGRSGEVALLEMSSQGLSEVKESDSYWQAQHTEAISGCAIAPVLLGSRVVCVEIQALVVSSYLASPRRSTSGFDLSRLHLLLAVLEKRLKIPFSKSDVYLNVVGGLKVSDPGADFAVAVALASAHWDKAVSLRHVFCGEIGLTGELREVVAMSEREEWVKRSERSRLYAAPSKKTQWAMAFSRVDQALQELFKS